MSKFKPGQEIVCVINRIRKPYNGEIVTVADYSLNDDQFIALVEYPGEPKKWRPIFHENCFEEIVSDKRLENDLIELFTK